MAGLDDSDSTEEGATLINRRTAHRTSSAALSCSGISKCAQFGLLALILAVQLLMWWEVRAARTVYNTDSADSTMSPLSTNLPPLSTPPCTPLQSTTPTLSLPAASPASLPVSPTITATPSSPRRYLGVLSCWERMANAVISFGQLLDMAALTTSTAHQMSIIAPTVMYGELGILHKADSLHFDTYFDLTALQLAGLPLVSMDEFVRRAERPQLVGPTLLLPIQRLLFIDYDNRVQPAEFDDNGLSECANIALPDVSGVGRQRHNVSALGLYVTEVKCVSPLVNLTDALHAVYGTLDTHRPLTVYLYQHRKTRTQPKLHSLVFDHLAPRYSTAIAAHTWSDKYAVVQMRAGWFIRCGTAACRQKAPARMLECAVKLANATHTAMRTARLTTVLIASDIYGSVPEYFPNENYESAFAAVRELLEAAFGEKRVTVSAEEVDMSGLDPIGTSTLLDFQLTKQAHTVVGMARKGWWTSGYTAQIAEARKRLGRETVPVEC